MEISSIIIILIALIITILELTNSSADTFYEGFINRFTIFYKISAEYLIKFIAEYVQFFYLIIGPVGKAGFLSSKVNFCLILTIFVSF